MANLLLKSLYKPRPILIAVFLVISAIIAVNYGKWEVLTSSHGKEFNTPSIIDDIAFATRAKAVPPKFIKVIDYSDTEAYVLWVVKDDGSYRTRVGTLQGESKMDSHLGVTFVKEKKGSVNSKWIVESWQNCTPPKEGRGECFFPYYGAISF
jgi:hypothetical protein